MLRPITTVLCVLLATSLAAATAERDSVIRVIEDFFAAMTARDVDRMRSLMSEDGMIYGYRESADGLKVLRQTHAEYLGSLATGSGKLVERFWEPRLMLHGRLATVWTPYDFHVDGQFSHCGVNNFSMLRTDTGWIITGVVFSIEVDRCTDSPLGPLADAPE